MKRYIRYTSTHNKLTELLELEVDVYMCSDPVSAASVLDLNDSEFFAFESDILENCEMRGYQLEDSYQSSVEGSVSQHYIYSKTNEDGTRLRVLVKIRVSDHESPDRQFKGRTVPSGRLAYDHVHERARELAKARFNQTSGYRPRFIDIVFDDEHFNSYEDALRQIEAKLDEFDR